VLQQILEYLQPILLSLITGLLAWLALQARAAAQRVPHLLLVLAVRFRDHAKTTKGGADDAAAALLVMVAEAMVAATTQTFGQRKGDQPAEPAVHPNADDRRQNSRTAADIVADQVTPRDVGKRIWPGRDPPK
jgi:hypothetical protein